MEDVDFSQTETNTPAENILKAHIVILACTFSNIQYVHKKAGGNFSV